MDSERKYFETIGMKEGPAYLLNIYKIYQC